MENLGFFSEQLAHSMVREKLTAKALAQTVECSYEFVRKMLNGKSLPSLRLLRRLCTTFEWRERDLRRFVMMDEARGRFGDSFWIVLGKDPKLEPFYILWEFLTPKEKNYFSDYLRFLVERKHRKQDGGNESV
jgi:hypothetical protein